MNSNQSRQSVTIPDVARAAGVSVGTVSRVLNGHPNITQKNIERVQKAIADLRYEKCRSAEMLVSRRNGSRVQTGNVGMVYTEMAGDWSNHPLVAAYSMGVERACREKGFHALIEFCGDSQDMPRCVRDGKVDGLLVKATRGLPEYVRDLPKDFPVVCVGLNEPTAKVQQVAPDNRGAGWMVVDYLWSVGHRRIGFVCSDLMHPMFLARFQGYEGALRAKRAFDPTLCALDEAELVDKAPELCPPNMRREVEKLLSAPGEPVTAIVAANDWMAQGVYGALDKLGRRIPGDISVVGFDNAVQVCTSVSPQLTSFAIPFGDVAYSAALKVMERVKAPDTIQDHSLHLVRGTLIERASVRRLAEPLNA
ncbi:LacI family transcriptional regulator [Spartobacteria bacterium LR76]|nr:LacI family transcriptional regulator [Spartobacteria bacterium LR76]